MFMFYSLLLFICACGMVYYINKDEEESVKIDVKNSQNIEEIARKNKLVCVKVSRDNCPYCDKIVADFAKLKSEFTNCVFLDLNQSKEKQYTEIVRKKYGINTVPAFIVFTDRLSTVIIGSDKLPEVKKLLSRATQEQELDNPNPKDKIN